MPRSKRRSATTDKADARATALSSINPALELGESLTLAAYKAKITATRTALEAYNTLLSNADAALVALEQSESELADLSERMLKGVASEFGRDSVEYEKAGGVRKSKIKRGTKSNVTDLKQAA
ncbi:MAG: hypothetical protein IPK15_22070 [Verrucomicrobia bacterium]|nr:hypothetical protein [Verrucomicrobiota bacterium]